MSRNYAMLIRKAEREHVNIPVPEEPEEMILWLENHADHVESDISQDQCQEEYRLAAGMIRILLNNATALPDKWT